MFDGPVRGGNRGGQGEFKWTDVSADKDRENYLGHSINAPTGRWQKNKDVHWYNRDTEQTAAEKAQEIMRIKEAEADALAIALGFKAAPKPGEVSNVPVTASIAHSAPGPSDNTKGFAIGGAATGSNAVPIAGDRAAPLAIEDTAALDERRRLKEEKRQRKEEKRAKKELKRAKKAEKAEKRGEDDQHRGLNKMSAAPRYSRSRSSVRSRFGSRSRSLSPKRLRSPPHPRAYAHRRSRSRTPPTPPRRIERYHRLPTRRSQSRENPHRLRSPSVEEKGPERRRSISFREEQYVNRGGREQGRSRERGRENYGYDRRERQMSRDRRGDGREREREQRGRYEERDHSLRRGRDGRDAD